MGPDDEDFEEQEPLPDPTMRTWRHPSELAAVAAMAARGDGPPPSKRRPAVGSLALGSVLGAITVLAVLAGTGLVDGGDGAGRVQFRNPTTVTVPSTTAPAPPPVPTTSPRDQGPSDATAPTSGPTTVASTAPAAVAPLGPELSAAELAVIPPGSIVGVLLTPDDRTPSSTGFVLGGHVVTSASAIGAATEVTLVIDGTAHTSAVIGRDPFTDVAVLAAPPGAPLHELVPGPPVSPGDPVALVATDGRAEPIAVIGKVTATDATGRADSGHTLIGLLTTSARLPEPGAGSLLVNPRGELVGMVVDTPEHVAAAVPEAVLRVVIRCLVETGHPAPVWIGVSALDSDAGVRLTAVDRRGPAFAAGLRRGDRLVSLGSTPVDDVGTFISALRAHVPGQQVPVTVERAGELVHLEVTIAAPQPPAPELPAVEERAAD